MHRYDPDNRNATERGGDGAKADVDAEVLAQARRVARSKIAFYKHAVAWAIVSAFLFLLDLFSGSGWWFFWPVLGWGIAVVFHASSVYLGDGFQKRLEDREVERMTRRRTD